MQQQNKDTHNHALSVISVWSAVSILIVFSPCEITQLWYLLLSLLLARVALGAQRAIVPWTICRSVGACVPASVALSSALWKNGGSDPSGGARVFAARGKRLCCRPRYIRPVLQSRYFSDMGCKPTLGALRFPPRSLSLFPPLSPSRLPIPHPFPSLNIRPLKSSYKVWGNAVSSSNGVCGRASADIEFGAFWPYNLTSSCNKFKDFLVNQIIKLHAQFPNFTQNLETRV